MPPKARVCYICGRQYMVHSFGIHVAQCQELFEKREALKPAKERRKCPADPASYFQDMRGEGASKLSGKGLDALNAAAQQKWTEEVLVQCHNCSRRFLPEKLPIHQRSCTAERPARRVSDPVARGPVSDYNAAASAAGNRALSAHDEYDEYASNTAVLGLNQCQSCGRRFNDIAFEKHVKICQKVFVKKRKVYDSSKHRTKGTDLESFQAQSRRRPGQSVGRSGNATQSGASASSSSSFSSSSSRGPAVQASQLPKWKQDSLAFRQAMRAAKSVSRAEAESKATGVPLHVLLKASGASSATAPPPIDPSYMLCPSCGRSFSQQAGQRHIPQCKNILSKPKHYIRTPGPSGSTAGTNHVPSREAHYTDGVSSFGTSRSARQPQGESFEQDYYPKKASGRSSMSGDSSPRSSVAASYGRTAPSTRGFESNTPSRNMSGQATAYPGHQSLQSASYGHESLMSSAVAGSRGGQTTRQPVPNSRPVELQQERPRSSSRSNGSRLEPSNRAPLARRDASRESAAMPTLQRSLSGEWGQRTAPSATVTRASAVDTSSRGVQALLGAPQRVPARGTADAGEMPRRSGRGAGSSSSSSSASNTRNNIFGF